MATTLQKACPVLPASDIPASGRISAPADRDWHMREFYVWDPNGNLLRFGQCRGRIPIA